MGTQKGPFFYSMILDANQKLQFELSAPMFGEKNLNFDLSNAQVSINENNLFKELLGISGPDKTQQVSLTSLFKNALIFLNRPSCSDDTYQCRDSPDGEKILIENSQSYYIQGQNKVYAFKAELFGQGEKYFDRVIFYLYEEQKKGQIDTEFLIIKIILKVQDCGNVRT